MRAVRLRRTLVGCANRRLRILHLEGASFAYDGGHAQNREALTDRSTFIVRSVRASRFCACPPSYAKDAPSRWRIRSRRFAQPTSVLRRRTALIQIPRACHSVKHVPLSTDRG